MIRLLVLNRGNAWYKWKRGPGIPEKKAITLIEEDGDR
jgi:hypothetical protein